MKNYIKKICPVCNNEFFILHGKDGSSNKLYCSIMCSDMARLERAKMKMKRCKCCGWYFEPQTPRQVYCDDECRQEGLRMSWRRYGKKRYARHKAGKDKKKPSAVLKVDVSRLPVPPLPATKEVRIGEVVKDSEISSLMEHFSYDPSSAKKEYTEDEDATIIRMADEGETYRMIASKIGGNPNAIKIHHQK